MSLSASTEAYECDGCGACCKTFPIFASAEDAAREPRIASEGRILADHLQSPDWRYQLYPLPFQEQCCLLDNHNRCTVYSTRPRICQAFAPGSPQCQEARQRQSLPPLAPQTSSQPAQPER